MTFDVDHSKRLALVLADWPNEFYVTGPKSRDFSVHDRFLYWRGWLVCGVYVPYGGGRWAKSDVGVARGALLKSGRARAVKTRPKQGKLP